MSTRSPALPLISHPPPPLCRIPRRLQVPLGAHFDNYLKEEDRFSVTMAKQMADAAVAGKTFRVPVAPDGEVKHIPAHVGLVVDLTKSSRYYNPQLWVDMGMRYSKVRWGAHAGCAAAGGRGCSECVHAAGRGRNACQACNAFQAPLVLLHSNCKLAPLAGPSLSCPPALPSPPPAAPARSPARAAARRRSRRL